MLQPIKFSFDPNTIAQHTRTSCSTYKAHDVIAVTLVNLQEVAHFTIAIRVPEIG